MNRTRIGVLVALAGAGAAVLSACGGNDMAGMANMPGMGGANPAMGQAGHVMLSVTDVSGVGKVVAAADGKTLYRFDKDTANPSVSNCEGSCLTSWTPATAGTGDLTPMLVGVDQKLVGWVSRKDGTKQLTLNGWPLYEFAHDQAPGQASGQGVNGQWFAVTPTGAKAPGSAKGAGSSDGSGY